MTDLSLTSFAFYFILVLLGYLLGKFTSNSPTKSLSNSSDDGFYSSKFYPNNKYSYTKLILCVRKDLSMTAGKIAAQCSHATLGIVSKVLNDKNDSLLIDIWKSYGQPKIVVKLKDLEHMNEIKKEAQNRGLPTHTVCDAGKTQVMSGTYTVLAVGPGPEDIINQVTGKLRLL